MTSCGILCRNLAVVGICPGDVPEQNAIAKMREDPYYFIDDPNGLLNR